MIQGEQQSLQILRLRRIERSVEIAHAEFLGLVSGEQIRLRAGAAQLKPDIGALKIMIAVRQQAVTGRTGPSHIGAQRRPARKRPVFEALIGRRADQPPLPGVEPRDPCGLNRSPIKSNSSGQRIANAQR